MADVQKPVVAAETPVEATTAAPIVPVAAEPSTEVVAPKVEETVKPEGETPTVAAVAEETKKEEKPVEPILSGALKYKGPGLKNAFLFSSKYFWVSDEPISVQDLNDYLRGEKADVAHPTAAWSSQSGKGLLYFVKHADKKDKPAGILNLADGTDLAKDGTTEFHLKVHGHKHTFQAKTAPERNGWFLTFENSIEAGKAEKETITQSEGYKAELEKLGKPAALVAIAAKEGSTPKKSIETPKPAETTAAEPVVAESSTVPPRTASSSSSSSSDEDKKKKKSKSKSRSVSRGKRASIFGSFLGKKDKAEEKVEEKKEEHDAKKVEETPAVAPIAEASTTAAPVVPVTEEPVKAAEVPKTEETAPVVPAVATEDKAEEKPKAAKRNSVFGFIDKLRSPTTEKKEADLLPAPAAKESETTAVAPKVEETPAVTATAPVIAPLDVAEAPKVEETPKVEAPKTEEAKPAATTPHKEKQSFSFGKFLGSSKDKVKSPTTEAPVAKVEEPAKVEETPAPVVAAAPTPVEPVAAETTKEETSPETTPAGKKRGSLFSNLIRTASKAGRSKKEKEQTATPAKVEEAAEPKEETPAVATTEEKKEETPVVPAATTEPATIGDVVPDAVTVGQAPKSTPQVSSTA